MVADYQRRQGCTCSSSDEPCRLVKVALPIFSVRTHLETNVRGCRNNWTERRSPSQLKDRLTRLGRLSQRIPVTWYFCCCCSFSTAAHPETDTVRLKRAEICWNMQAQHDVSTTVTLCLETNELRQGSLAHHPFLKERQFLLGTASPCSDGNVALLCCFGCEWQVVDGPETINIPQISWVCTLVVFKLYCTSCVNKIWIGHCLHSFDLSFQGLMLNSFQTMWCDAFGCNYINKWQNYKIPPEWINTTANRSSPG